MARRSVIEDFSVVMQSHDFLVVLSDIYHPDSVLDDYVAANLASMRIESKFAASTEEFYELDGPTQSHILVIGSEWTFMLESDLGKSPEVPSFLFLQIDRDPPLNGRKFIIKSRAKDGELLQKHIRAWLSDR